MKTSLMVICLLFVGCSRQPQSARDNPPEVETKALPASYVVLADLPDATLDAMASKYVGVNWRREWTEEAALLPLDGQRTIHLLEIACYADVTCHRIEYPLRIATLDHIREHLATPGVRDAIQWIRVSYESGLPLEEPDDVSGQFKGAMVHAMKVRMREYATGLLKQKPEQDK